MLQHTDDHVTVGRVQSDANGVCASATAPSVWTGSDHPQKTSRQFWTDGGAERGLGLERRRVVEAWSHTGITVTSPEENLNTHGRFQEPEESTMLQRLSSPIRFQRQHSRREPGLTALLVHAAVPRSHTQQRAKHSWVTGGLTLTSPSQTANQAFTLKE